MDNFAVVFTNFWAISKFETVYCFSNNKYVEFKKDFTKNKGRKFTNSFLRFLQENNVSENKIFIAKSYLDMEQVIYLIKNGNQFEKFELNKTIKDKILLEYLQSKNNLSNEKTN